MAFLFGRNPKTSAAIALRDQDRRNSHIAGISVASSPTAIETTIQDNIVRIQTFNHVSDKYDIIDMIGQGSMGAIYKVRIKPNKLGGSAFYPKVPSPTSSAVVTSTTNTNHRSFVSRFKVRLSKGARTTGKNNSSTTISSGSTLIASTASVTPTLTNVLHPPRYDDTVMNRHVYALKTIRLDNITDMVDDDMIKAFLDEMINEMNILRSMDHPNIIKAHEIFMTKPPLSPSPSDGKGKSDTESNELIKGKTSTTAFDNDLLQHQHMCIALELCTGGNLYSRAPYSETDAAYILEQILSAARYMHDRGIVHRDLKFENILFHSDDLQHHAHDIKILDFGLSKQFKHKKTGYMYERVGTIYTMAPEVLINDDNIPYTAQAEVWSIGVIAYMLLCKDNKKPFFHTDFHTMIDLIQEGKVNYDAPTWDKSDVAKDFVQHLLQVNPYQRYTIVQALQHPFIQQRDRTIHEIPSPQIYKNIECSIKQYSQQETSILKKLALSIIAHDSTTNRKQTSQIGDIHNNASTGNHSTIDQLQKAFIQFDTEKNGILSYDEFKTAILQTISQEHDEVEDDTEGETSPQRVSSLHENNPTTTNNEENHPTIFHASQSTPPTYTEDELKRIFASLDINQNGMIMYTEFLAATIEACGRIEDDRLAEAFDRLDCDDTGYISEENLRELLGPKCSDLEIKAIITAADKDHDGKISFADFLQAFHENDISYTSATSSTR